MWSDLDIESDMRMVSDLCVGGDLEIRSGSEW